MHVGTVLVLLLISAALTSPTAARLLTEACSALTSTSLQFKDTKLDAVGVSAHGDGCCEACQKLPGCQMWWAKGGTCELYSLDKGPITWNILYQTKAGILTTGPSALVEQSSDCGDSTVWLFKGIAFDGVIKGSSADPFVLEAGANFKNGFPTKTWQECCKGALNAPGTSVMERHYQYRGRQYWTWNEAEGKCYVKVRPFQIGAEVLTMRRAADAVSGMFGSEP
jgi:hypothetical protein